MAAAESAVPRPHAVRTPFAIALQLGRSLPYLLAMTLASGRGEHRAVHLLAVKIVDAIRDRGRDKNLRPVIDQQQRTRPLTRARLRQTSRSFAQMAA